MKKVINALIFGLLLPGYVSAATNTMTLDANEQVRQQFAAGQDQTDIQLHVNYVSPISVKSDSSYNPTTITMTAGVTASDILSLLENQADTSISASHEDVYGNRYTFNGSSISKAYEPLLHHTLDKLNLCMGSADPGIVPRKLNNATLSTRMTDCANYAPLEYTTAINIFENLIAWRSKESKAMMDMLLSKLRSNALKDRIYSRLLLQCLNNQLQNNGTTGETSYEGVNAGLVHSGSDSMMPDLALVLTACSNPENWDFTKTFTMPDLSTCSSSFKPSTAEGFTTESSNTEFAFDFSVFIRGCIVNEHTTPVDSKGDIPFGDDVALGLIPYTKLLLNREDQVTSVRLRTYPMSYSPNEVYEALYRRAYNLISSESFLQMKTRGCIPSPFAPRDFDELVEKENSGWERYCSIWVPPRVVQVLGDSELQDDAQFFWSLLAKRIAVIQSMEILKGAELITKEAQRFFRSADRDISSIIDPSVQYIEDASKLYLDSVDMSYSTKLEDLMKLAVNYIESKRQTDSAARETRSKARLFNYEQK